MPNAAARNAEISTASNPWVGVFWITPRSMKYVEGFFSIFKRGMKGVYQHCSEKHLHRYLAEFDFRYNHRVRLGYSDYQRAEILLAGVVGRRLTYQTTVV